MNKVIIFAIASELNISHEDILSFLKSKKVDVESHMSWVDEKIHQLIINEFAEGFKSKIKYEEIEDGEVSGLNPMPKSRVKDSNGEWVTEDKLKPSKSNIGHSNSDGLEYSETLNEYMPIREIRKDHISTEDGWLHEDQIGRDR